MKEWRNNSSVDKILFVINLRRFCFSKISIYFVATLDSSWKCLHIQRSWLFKTDWYNWFVNLKCVGIYKKWRPNWVSWLLLFHIKILLLLTIGTILNQYCISDLYQKWLMLSNHWFCVYITKIVVCDVSHFCFGPNHSMQFLWY